MITGFNCSRALQGSPRQVLRQRRFALRDHFDLTRAPDVSAPGSLGGLHAIEIQVGLGLGEIGWMYGGHMDGGTMVYAIWRLWWMVELYGLWSLWSLWWIFN